MRDYTDSMDEPVANPRSNRLHRSTWAWLICTFALLVIAILPGSHGEPVWRYHLIEHGWPFIYVIRDAHPFYRPNLWGVATQVVDFYPLYLLADLLIAVAILATIGLLCERRARLRASAPRQRIHAGCLAAFAVETMRYFDARRLESNDGRYPPVVPSFLRPLLTVCERFGIELHGRYWFHDPPNNDRDLGRLKYLMQRYPDAIALFIDSSSSYPIDAEQLKQLARLRAQMLVLSELIAVLYLRKNDFIFSSFHADPGL